MDKQRMGGGVKITYIETQFVTSDEAGFKDLVQRLTGRSPATAPAPAAVTHRPRACRVGGGRVTADDGPGQQPQGHHYPAREVRRPAVVGRAPPCLKKLRPEMDDFISELFYVGASEQRHPITGSTAITAASHADDVRP